MLIYEVGMIWYANYNKSVLKYASKFKSSGYIYAQQHFGWRRDFLSQGRSSASLSLLHSELSSGCGVYAMYITFGLTVAGSSSAPGASGENPRNMNVRTSMARSIRLLAKQMTTCSHCNSSSAYSNSLMKLSFEPSGNIPLGISTNKRPSSSTVSQTTSLWSVNAIAKRKLRGCVFVSQFDDLTLELTGGSFETPTPLPSVKVALAAWGTSGPRSRPWTQTDTTLLIHHVTLYVIQSRHRTQRIFQRIRTKVFYVCNCPNGAKQHNLLTSSTPTRLFFL